MKAGKHEEKGSSKVLRALQVILGQLIERSENKNLFLFILTYPDCVSQRGADNESGLNDVYLEKKCTESVYFGSVVQVQYSFLYQFPVFFFLL